MSILEYILGGLLFVIAVGLVLIIGAQQNKRRSGLSNSIAGSGASESYLAKNNIGTKDGDFKKYTLILAIVFVVIVLALYIIGSVEPTQDETSTPVAGETSTTISNTSSDASSDVSDTSADTSVEESASESVDASADESVEESAVESVEETSAE